VGGNASGSTKGTGAAPIGGNGGTGGDTAGVNNATASLAPGGGGGGAGGTTTSSSAGSIGRVIITWTSKTDGRHGNSVLRPHAFSPGLAR
jgi:hypothetical protein